MGVGRVIGVNQIGGLRDRSGILAVGVQPSALIGGQQAFVERQFVHPAVEDVGAIGKGADGQREGGVARAAAVLTKPRPGVS